MTVIIILWLARRRADVCWVGLSLVSSFSPKYLATLKSTILVIVRSNGIATQVGKSYRHSPKYSWDLDLDDKSLSSVNIRARVEAVGLWGWLPLLISLEKAHVKVYLRILREILKVAPMIFLGSIPLLNSFLFYLHRCRAQCSE